VFTLTESFFPRPCAEIGEALRLLYDFARLKTDAAEQHAVANSLRSPLAPGQLCQRRGAMFARRRMEAQLYSLRASATRSLGGTGQRPMQPHYSRDLAHGPGVGSGLWPQLPPPTCSRRVRSVRLGPFCYVASLPRSPGHC
jgi:hypothetical protein